MKIFTARRFIFQGLRRNVFREGFMQCLLERKTAVLLVGIGLLVFLGRGQVYLVCVICGGVVIGILSWVGQRNERKLDHEM